MLLPLPRRCRHNVTEFIRTMKPPPTAEVSREMTRQPGLMGNFQRIAVVLMMIMSPDANKSSDTEHPVWQNREKEAFCFPDCQKLLSETTAPQKTQSH